MIDFLVSIETPILVIHFVTAVFLMIVILLQSGKGDVGSVFGVGGSQNLFGPRGAATLLTKLTTIGAIIFLCTSLSLTAVSRHYSKAPKTELPEELFNSSVNTEKATDTVTDTASASDTATATDSDTASATATGTGKKKKDN